MLYQRSFYLLSLSIAASSAFTTPAGSREKRDIEYKTTLYAYGSDSTATPIAYNFDNGLLYITDTPDDSSANLTSVTWDVPFVSDENWIVNATLPNGTALGSLYIRSNQNNAIGVLPNTGDPVLEGTVTGFARFAWQLVCNNNTWLDSKFWAEPTEAEGIDALVWSSGEDLRDGSYDVVVEVVAES